MCTYLKNMEGYKLKDLKSKGFDSIQEMFDRSFKRVNTFEDFKTELVEGKEKREGEELIQESSKKQKVDDDKEPAELKPSRKRCRSPTPSSAPADATTEVMVEPDILPVHPGQTIEDRLDEYSEMIRGMYEHLLDMTLSKIEETEVEASAERYCRAVATMSDCPDQRHRAH
ncbi:hypothetical protein Tco_0600161 [Tanacetum coccineum]|uniref:Uncharacterized protein n=1 Tax=Tanacetum coccineum TaxID=301880 RepID=A0ABQ4WAZ8_9ASTR